MEQGKKYRVTMRHTPRRKEIEEEMVAVYLGEAKTKFTHDQLFSLRPEAGTQTIPNEWIQKCVETTEPVSLPRRV